MIPRRNKKKEGEEKGQQSKKLSLFFPTSKNRVIQKSGELLKTQNRRGATFPTAAPAQKISENLDQNLRFVLLTVPF